MGDWKQWKIKIILIDDDIFPGELRKIRNYPKKLYYRGEWNKSIFEKTLAVVGSRRMTRYGREIMEKFMPEIVANKVTVISGFMYGIDTEAHTKCVESGGKTIAVLGGGLDVLLPTENNELYTKILENGGLMISEYEPDFQPTLWSFPQRNRIVAGLATIGVLIVEAGMKSGSLITARLARQMGKKIWAVPGGIFSEVSEGVNYLIKNDLAKMMTSTVDIFENKSAENSIQVNLFEDSLDDCERKIIGALKNEDLSVDEIGRKLELTITEVLVKISALSLKNIIEEENGRVYLIK
ncbi:MAG: DNA-processing protein DprA [Candidatus Shapirobacteria bacterium]